MKLGKETVLAMIALLAGMSNAQSTTAECPRYVTAWTVTGSGTSRATLTEKPVSFANQWTSKGPSRYHHVIDGTAGKVRLKLEACSAAAAGTTVSVYPALALGVRQPAKGRLLLANTTLRTPIEQAISSIPPSRAGSKLGTLHLVVIVESASRSLQTGSYRLMVSRL